MAGKSYYEKRKSMENYSKLILRLEELIERDLDELSEELRKKMFNVVIIKLEEYKEKKNG